MESEIFEVFKLNHLFCLSDAVRSEVSFPVRRKKHLNKVTLGVVISSSFLLNMPQSDKQ